jgi:beta-lactamase regulating signal transducer with metallopeptidase domain
MNLPFHLLNSWGDRWAEYAWAGLWQSSVLITVLWVLDRLLRNRLRPVVRHALWMLVLIKMVLPASLALPTGVGYWFPRGGGREAELNRTQWLVREIPDTREATPFLPSFVPSSPPTQASIRMPGFLMLVWLAGVVVMGAVVVRRTLLWRRWQQQEAELPEWVTRRFDAVRAEVGFSRGVDLRGIPEGQSPVLCGLWRPTLLLPRGLGERLTAEQLRAVFLHELVHARRGDVWVNALQVGLQILWWWHPLLWLANARLRATREEVVDEEVAFRMGENSISYPEALLEVAKAAVFRPVFNLGLLGIVESRSALRVRIQRLLADPPARMPRLGRWGYAGTVLLGLVLLPMAGGQSTTSDSVIEPRPPVGVVTGVEVTWKPGGEYQAGMPAGIPTHDLLGRGVVVPWRDEEPWTETAQERPRSFVATRHAGNEASDPERTTIEPDPGVSATDDGTKLVTRTYRLDYSVVIPALEKRLGRNLGEDFGAWTAAIREAFEGVGFSMLPPNAMFITLRKAMLMVRGPEAQVAKVNQLLTELSARQSQVLIEARFLELTEEAFRSLPLDGNPVTEDAPVVSDTQRLLTDSQHRRLLEAVKRRGDVRELAAPRVVTLSGRRAEIRQSDAGTNAPLYVVELRPEVLGTNYSIRLDTRVQWRQEVRLDSGSLEERVSGSNPVPGPSGWVYSPNRKAYVERSATNTVVLLDGDTQVLGDLGPEDPPFGLKRVIVLLKAVLIDAAGNPVHPWGNSPPIDLSR